MCSTAWRVLEASMLGELGTSSPAMEELSSSSSSRSTSLGSGAALASSKKNSQSFWVEGSCVKCADLTPQRETAISWASTTRCFEAHRRPLGANSTSTWISREGLSTMRNTHLISGYKMHLNQLDHYGLLWFRYIGRSWGHDSLYFKRDFDNMCPSVDL